MADKETKTCLTCTFKKKCSMKWEGLRSSYNHILELIILTVSSLITCSLRARFLKPSARLWKNRCWTRSNSKALSSRLEPSKRLKAVWRNLSVCAAASTRLLKSKTTTVMWMIRLPHNRWLIRGACCVFFSTLMPWWITGWPQTRSSHKSTTRSCEMQPFITVVTHHQAKRWSKDLTSFFAPSIVTRVTWTLSTSYSHWSK